jgi:4-amino-4-deoxy-L-arabinose transferase-like glycosyltransferase
VSPQARRLIAAAAVFLYAFGLRAALLGRHPFHMDEALYAGFSSRIVHGDLLLTGGLNNDKPPLQPYLGALGMALFGESESAPRLMNCLLSAFECAALLWFLWPMTGALLAALAALLVAGAPIAAGYGASALMDGPMSLFLLLAFCLSASSRPWAAGLCWGLAAASKQTAWFLLPFFLAAVWVGDYAPRASLKRFAQGSAWILLPLLLWSAAFQHPRLGMVLLMKANQPEVGPGWVGLGGRWVHWMSLGEGLFQGPWIFSFLLVCGLAGSAWLFWRWRKRPELRAWALAGVFAPLCLLLFAFLKMRDFDRYLLPLAPFSALGLALPLGELTRGRAGLRLLFLPALGLLLFANRGLRIPPTQQGVGFAANDGMDAAFAEMKRLSPEGGTLYSPEGGAHWMGNFYLGKNWSLFETQDPPVLKGDTYLLLAAASAPPPKAAPRGAFGRFALYRLGARP